MSASNLEEKQLEVFFKAWCGNGFNAKKAYLTLHPEVGEHSAETLGSRMLRKVEVSELLSAYRLGPEEYFRQLKEGLGAEGKMGPDHRVRRIYHEVLGKLLRYENKDDIPGEKTQYIVVTRGEGIEDSERN